MSALDVLKRGPDTDVVVIARSARDEQSKGGSGPGAVPTLVLQGMSDDVVAPMHAREVYPEHDLFIQLMKLKNTLRYIKGEELITHLGREYYD